MIVVHRISLRATETQLKKLQFLGVTVPPGVVRPGGGAPFVGFDVQEDHPNWDTLQNLFRQWDTGDQVSTRFSPEEIEAAGWLSLLPSWHHGYPQPEEPDFAYLRATYDLSEWCEHCGIGRKQRAPFQMKGEPKWGRRGILQLNWIFDEFFVTPQVWSGVFRPHGIESRIVTNTKGAELKTVVQLVLVDEVGIETKGMPSERCEQCDRVKLLPWTRGFFPKLLVQPTQAIARTKDYFGSGARAYKRVLISRELGRSMVAAKVRGAEFWPVQSSHDAP